MLKLKPEAPETITETIDVTIPGQKQTGKLTATFRFRNKAEFLEFTKSCGGRDDVDNVMDVLTGWSGIDADFTRDNVAEFLNNYPAAALEIVSAYGRVLFESRVKN